MVPYEHQERISKEAYNILKEHGVVYLSMEERTGKTLTSILACERTQANKILIITKKKAIKGWEETLKAYQVTKEYIPINYEAIHKLDSTNFDLAILDEAHANLSAYPKLGTRAKQVQKITYNLPLILLSATPSAQSLSQLYHQFQMTKYSPFYAYTTFYRWFSEFGIPSTVYLHGRQVPKYDEVQIHKLWNKVKHLFISYTRKELGFEHEPNDILHFIDLKEETKVLYRELEKTDTIESLEYVADTPMKKLLGLHQLEGGTLKLETKSFSKDCTAKIEFIKENWGDTKDLVIFYQYKAEEDLLNYHFKKAQVLQGTSFAEGVDLSMYKTLVVYSMDFSTARYTQRRARQCNMKREEAIDVHYLLVKNGISHQVYNTVAINKKNFVNRYYQKGLL